MHTRKAVALHSTSVTMPCAALLQNLGLCLFLLTVQGVSDDPLLLGFRVSSGLPLPKTFSFLQAHRDSPAVRRIEQAELLARTGRLEDAAAAYESVLSSYTMGSEAQASLYLAMGSVYGAMWSSTLEAEQSFRSAVDCSRLAHLAHWALGSLYAREGRFGDAARELEISLALRPGWFAALHDLGSVLIIQGHVDQGIEYFERAVRSLEDAGMDLAGIWEESSSAALYNSPRVSPSLLEKHLIDHILQVFLLPEKRGGWEKQGGGGGGGSSSSGSSLVGGDEGSASGDGNSEFASVGASLWGFLQKLQTIDIAQFHRGMGLKLGEAGAFEDGARHLRRALALAPSNMGSLAIFTTLTLPLVYGSKEEVWTVRSRLVRKVREALEDREAVIHPELLTDLYMLQFQLPYSGLPAHLLMRDISRWLSSCENPTLITVSPGLSLTYPEALAAATGHSGFLELSPPHAAAPSAPQGTSSGRSGAEAAGEGAAGPGVRAAAAGPRRVASGSRQSRVSAAAPGGSGSLGSSGSSGSSGGAGDGGTEERALEESSPAPPMEDPSSSASSMLRLGGSNTSGSGAGAASWNPFIISRGPASRRSKGSSSRSSSDGGGGTAAPPPPPPPPTVRVGIITYQTFDCATGHLLHTLARHLRGYRDAVKESPPRFAAAAATKMGQPSQGPSFGAGALPRWLTNTTLLQAGSWDAPFIPPSWLSSSPLKGTTCGNSSNSAASEGAGSAGAALGEALLASSGSYLRHSATPIAGFHTTLFQMTNLHDDLTRMLLSQVDSVVNVPKLMKEAVAMGAAAAGSFSAGSSSSSSSSSSSFGAATKHPPPTTGTVFDLPTIRRIIMSAGVDVLIVADPGLSPSLYTLLFSRLAPVQVALWGGETAGLLTLGLPNSCDYFVTGDDISPDGTQKELLEQSVRLGGLGTYLPKMRPRTPKEVADVVAEHGVLAGQHLFFVPAPLNALHPAFDAALLGILAADPAARIVLMCETGQDLWVGKLRRRLAAHPLALGHLWQAAGLQQPSGSGEGGSSSAGGEGSAAASSTPGLLSRLSFYEERVGTIGASSTPHQRALISAADAVLDTFPVGLGLPALEALSEGTPIVTLPSAHPGRSVAGGAARALGLCEGLLCVSSVEEYIARAVAFAGNSSLRGAVRAKLSARSGALQWENWDRWVKGSTKKAPPPSGGGGGGSGSGGGSKRPAAAPAVPPLGCSGEAGGGDADTRDWWEQRLAAGLGDPALGALHDWLTFLSRVGRPWALSRERVERDRTALATAGALEAGGAGGGGGRRSGVDKARAARERKERRGRERREGERNK